MSARERILARVRAGLADAVNRFSAEDIEHHVLTHMRGPAPPDSADVLNRFKAHAIELGSDVVQVPAARQAPAAIAQYLSAHRLTHRAVSWKAFMDLDWRASGIEVEARAAVADDLVGITGAFCAIAETGTLMLLSGADTPATVSLLPETHVAIVASQRIVATMEDAWQQLRVEQGRMPRAVNFISGPSRTADIEQTVTLGAHGPYRVLIVLVSPERGDE